MDTNIVLKLNGITNIEQIKVRTGEKDSLVINSNKLALALNVIYKLPITNSTLSLDEANCISPIGKINRKLDIRDVSDGHVYILPLIHGVFVVDGEVLGKLI
jgi:hypothetical protein